MNLHIYIRVAYLSKHTNNKCWRCGADLLKVLPAATVKELYDNWSVNNQHNLPKWSTVINKM